MGNCGRVGSGRKGKAARATGTLGRLFSSCREKSAARMDFHQENDRTAWVIVDVDHRGGARGRETDKDREGEGERGRGMAATRRVVEARTVN